MKNGPAPRTNVAPVSDVTDRDGWTIKAGTVGKLSYTGGSRGWCFIYAFAGRDYAHDVLKADLFRFVPATELASAVLGHDVAAGEIDFTTCRDCGAKITAERQQDMRDDRTSESWVYCVACCNFHTREGELAAGFTLAPFKAAAHAAAVAARKEAGK